MRRKEFVKTTAARYIGEGSSITDAVVRAERDWRLYALDQRSIVIDGKLAEYVQELSAQFPKAAVK